MLMRGTPPTMSFPLTNYYCRVTKVCKGNTTLAGSVELPGYTASFSAAQPDMRGRLRGGLVVGGLTMHMFRINQDFRASAHGTSLKHLHVDLLHKT